VAQGEHDHVTAVVVFVEEVAVRVFVETFEKLVRTLVDELAWQFEGVNRGEDRLVGSDACGVRRVCIDAFSA
jgi:hypothetical protein